MTGITTVGDFAGATWLCAARVRRWGRRFIMRYWRMVLNIGRIANLSLLLPIRGYDTGPGNMLLDAWTWRHRKAPYDQDGSWASGGQVHQGLLQHLLADGYLLRPAPKSTGREYFNLGWLERDLARLGPIARP